MSFITNHQEQFLVLIAEKKNDCSILDFNLDQTNLRVILSSEQNEISTLLNKISFNLILLDLDFFDLLKVTDSINSQTPAIAIIDSTNNNQYQKQNIITAGFDDYITRPLNMFKVKEIIALWHINNKSASPFDYIRAIMNATQNNHHLALIIFKKLFEELPLQISAIENALLHQNYPLAQEIAHKLHGSASFCGLAAIEKSASTLEMCLINKDYSAIKTHLMTLQQYILILINQQKSILELLEIELNR